MQLRQLKEHDQIQLKEDIQVTLGNHDAIDQHPDRTPGKDKTAQWIESNVIETNRWPLAATDIESEIKDDPDYNGPESRQHITNVLESYYHGGLDNTRNSTAQMDSKPFSAAPDSLEAQPQPHIETEDTLYIAFVESGEIKGYSQVSIPENVEDLDTFLQGVIAGLDST